MYYMTMIKIRSRIRGGYDRNGDFVIQRKIGTRIFNGILVLGLAIVVIAALIRGESISTAGIILFGLVFVATAFNAGENKRFAFSARDGRLLVVHSFAGIPLRRLEIPLQALTRVMMAGIEFDIQSRTRRNPGIYKLQVRVDADRLPDDFPKVDSKLTIEDSTDAEELHDTGSALAGFLRLEFESDYSPGSK